MNTQWYFYLIQAGEHGPVKLGITERLPKRLIGHQVSNPDVLKILCKIPCEDREHASIIERNFAGATRDYLTAANNEWRLPSIKDLAVFADPLSAEPQCSRGHLWPEELTLRENREGLPMCPICATENHLKSHTKCKGKYRAQNRIAAAMKREQYPEQAKANSQRGYAKFRDRYQNDPVFREKQQEYQRQWKAKNRDKANAYGRKYYHAAKA